jgi:hypothetical protein
MAVLVPLPCEALLDQDRYIGGDPVGHACFNSAQELVWLDGFSWRVCSDCAALIRANSDRVTLRPLCARPGEG